MKLPGLLLASCMLISCSPPEVVLRPEGTVATIQGKTGETRDGQLVAVRGETLYVISDTLLAIPRSGIGSVELQIDEGRGWLYPVIIFQAVPSLALLLSNDRVASEIGAAGLGLTAATWLCFELLTPRTTYLEPMTEADLDELSVHLRFPYDIPESALKELRESLRRRGR